MSKEVRWKLFFALIALGHALNGLWMLISPLHWYETLPGREPDFGPLNEHFVRDLGCAFILISLFLGLLPLMSYYFTHGPSCPCHAMIERF